MNEIHIECAGAGKTYGIAKKITELINICPLDKKIYAITYTNYAVTQIKNEVKKELHYQPNNVIITTVDSFLLDHAIYPYSSFVKNEKITSCSIEKLSTNSKWSAKRKRQLKDSGIIHSSEVSQYTKSIIVPTPSDNKSKKLLKAIALEYLISDIYCLFVDEAQDMNKYFFELMFYIIGRIENYYFVGDPYQAICGSDQYQLFVRSVEEVFHISPIINRVSRRLPSSIVPLCNCILPQEFQISSNNNVSGEIAYILATELDEKMLDMLSQDGVFSIIKNKTGVFSTTNEKQYITHELRNIIIEKYPKYDADALIYLFIKTVEKEGLSDCLHKFNIEVEKEKYAILATQFENNTSSDICVHSIQKMKGLEDSIVYFIICNSLLEILLGYKNDYNKETNLLYVALTRSKNRLLLIVDDDETMKQNFQKLDIDIELALQNIGIPKADKADWFDANRLDFKR